ncbi:hypothetical protein Glove_505g11 [Diversispora epigaea]|uniref:HMG box domain-containing protein n=1 Tax=Diversispora epigaea TaxID=1348612 RepID=A0A397GHZ6_9GLOM|nr:hypothetical protein Glove_505g11 [Diversispora epigaea]
MSTKVRDFQFILGTSQTFEDSLKSSKTNEEAYFEQKKKVKELLLKPSYPIFLTLEELIETSSHSREGTKYNKNKRKYPPRSLNPFMIFRKNFHKGLRKNKIEIKNNQNNNVKKADIISILATQEWYEQDNPAVRYLFIELADLAKKRLLYLNPTYRYEPNKKSGNRVTSPKKESTKENSLATTPSIIIIPTPIDGENNYAEHSEEEYIDKIPEISSEENFYSHNLNNLNNLDNSMIYPNTENQNTENTKENVYRIYNNYYQSTSYSVPYDKNIFSPSPENFQKEYNYQPMEPPNVQPELIDNNNSYLEYFDNNFGFDFNLPSIYSFGEFNFP